MALLPSPVLLRPLPAAAMLRLFFAGLLMWACSTALAQGDECADENGLMTGLFLFFFLPKPKRKRTPLDTSGRAHACRRRHSTIRMCHSHTGAACVGGPSNEFHSCTARNYLHLFFFPSIVFFPFSKSVVYERQSCTKRTQTSTPHVRAHAHALTHTHVTSTLQHRP